MREGVRFCPKTDIPADELIGEAGRGEHCYVSRLWSVIIQRRDWMDGEVDQ